MQLCIAHKVCHSPKYVPWKEWKLIAADLRAIYGAVTLTEAEHTPSWLVDWERQRLTMLFDSPLAIRWVIYTTNAIESLHYTLRKRLKIHGVFPNDKSIVKVVTVQVVKA